MCNVNHERIYNLRTIEIYSTKIAPQSDLTFQQTCLSSGSYPESSQRCSPRTRSERATWCSVRCLPASSCKKVKVKWRPREKVFTFYKFGNDAPGWARERARVARAREAHTFVAAPPSPSPSSYTCAGARTASAHAAALPPGMSSQCLLPSGDAA